MAHHILRHHSHLKAKKYKIVLAISSLLYIFTIREARCFFGDILENNDKCMYIRDKSDEPNRAFTIKAKYAIIYFARGRSSAGRARQSHCRGQGFEPPRLHSNDC